jgi:hypothetical protein
LTRRRFRRDPTHALFADFPDNLVALFGHNRAWPSIIVQASNVEKLYPGLV